MEQPTMLSCNLCDEEFSTAQQLALHRREKHPRLEAPAAPQPQLQELSKYEDRGEVF